MPKEVLIVGGGVAGLAAGVALAGAGWRVRLFEQKPYLGGRARSFVDATTGSVVDNGQHVFMGCYHSTMRFLEEIGTADRVAFQPRLAIKFLDPPDRMTTLDCPDLPAPWHLLLGVLRSRSFGPKEKLEVLRFGRQLEYGTTTHDGIEQLTVEEWLARLGQSERLRRNFWDLLCIAAMNEDPRRAAAIMFERVLRLALFTSPADSRLGIARVGLSECYTNAATAYIESRKGRVELARNVTTFLTSEGTCRGLRLSDGTEVQGETVLSAVPWHQLARLLPRDLLLSEPFFARCLTLRPAPIISINLWFDRPVTDLDFVGLRGTTVQWLFNKGRIFQGGRSGTGPSYVSLVLSGAHQHIGRAKAELLEIALSDLSLLVPEVRNAKLIHALVLKERFATFSPNCEAELVRPPARTPVRGLFLAGDWTSTGLPATIEGAVQSGYTAAREILEAAGGPRGAMERREARA